MYQHTFFYLVLAGGFFALMSLLYQLVGDALSWLNMHGLSNNFVLSMLVLVALGITFMVWAQKRIMK